MLADGTVPFDRQVNRGSELSTKVAVLGGGIGGLSAAHELARRGFEVEVFEKLAAPGGKARSMPVPNTGKGGRRDLPGEHGFRFFPGFYQHLPATMAEIPFGSGGKTCFDNLVDTRVVQMSRFDKPPVRLLDGVPRSLDELKLALEVFGADLGLAKGEGAFFAARLWQVMTSCRPRREDESVGLEALSWWEFLRADQRSEAFQRVFAEGLSRSLVAARAREASARTIGQIQVHLFHDMLNPRVAADRVLRGPTSETFIDPWLDYLRGLGVSYHTDAVITALNLQGGRVRTIGIRAGSQEKEIVADWFVSALPVEVLTTLITPELGALDPGLRELRRLSKEVRWMNGIQFFLKTDVSINNGHTLYVDSPWALTSISQAQFWDGIHLSNTYGDGTVRGILSVDISDWDRNGIEIAKPAIACTAEEIQREVWAQLKRSLNVGGKVFLADDMVVDWFLDPAIITHDRSPTGQTTNAEPLFINMPKSWSRRPSAQTMIPNLLLAADYVRTRTDLACMEAANEAAKLAVNSILVQNSRTDFCRLFDMEMPSWLGPARAADRILYERGLPWGWPLQDAWT